MVTGGYIVDLRRALGPLALTLGTACFAQTPTLAVDAAANQHTINPNIYGIVNYGLDTTYAREIKVPNIRWGGDGTTRYNWQVDSSNAGFDWYFVGGSGQTNPVPSASADAMIRSFPTASALITIPIIPFVNKSAATTCSFLVSVYGAQQSTNPYVHPNGDSCGNSLTTSGAQLTDTNIPYNHIHNSTGLQQGWVQHLVSTFGTAATGGVRFYQLDNEPLGWGNTHRDVEPNGASYSTIVGLGEQYAAAVKAIDPTAAVMGPSDFTLGGWIGTPSQQNNLFAGQYYLQQMAAYDKASGGRVLDYFDEHYYPQFSDPTSQLASTRTLWDPTYNGGTWVEQYYFYGPMQLIPRFQSWITQYYPGTKLAFSEYSIDSGNKLITDALAEADVLGIFGREGVDFANMWSPPAPTDPIAYAFRLYRDYDGRGSQFGDTGVQATSTNQGQLAIYAAQRSSDEKLTLVVLNKSTSPIQSSVSLAHFHAALTAAVYSYSNADLTQITSAGTVPVAANSLSYTFPGYSATVFEIAPAPAVITPTVTWTTPASITSATPLSASQLDATASVPGTFLYSPGLGTRLTAGTQTLTATFTPANTQEYAPVTTTRPVNVLQATQVVLTAKKGPDAYNAAILTATVTPVNGSGAITGTVSIYTDAHWPLATGSLNNGSVSWVVPIGLTGLTIYGVYNGNSTDVTSTSGLFSGPAEMAILYPQH